MVVALICLFFFNDTATTEIYTLSLHDALPISSKAAVTVPTFLPLDNLVVNLSDTGGDRFVQIGITLELADEKTATTVKQYLPSIRNGILMLVSQRTAEELDRKSTRLNSSHLVISYA